jgi:hypothetical protein
MSTIVDVRNHSNECENNRYRRVVTIALSSAAAAAMLRSAAWRAKAGNDRRV